jgi:hypothetical protein
MFAASILIISLTGVAGVYSSVQRSLAHQRDLAAATVIAEAFLEQVVVLPKTNRFLIAGSHPRGGELVNRFGLDAQPTTSADAPFLLTWVVEEDKPLVGIRTVTVDVQWDRDGVHRVRLMTYRE